MKHFIILLLVFLTGLSTIHADNNVEKSPKYLALRDSMRVAFNNGDSARFYPALKELQDYLLEEGDLHNYYTQRCNEIVFLMNRQRIFEAYKLARELTLELSQKKLDSEMYMAYNMLGHLNRYCGNRETAKENFRKVISLMEKAGYYESMPPIYMNIVNVSLTDNPDEATEMLDKALEIAREYAPDRVFDIETRKTLSYFNRGDMAAFLEGYKKYRKGVAEGKSSVHGRSMDIYYEVCQGNTDRAVAMARKHLGDEAYETITLIYERASMWKEAFESLKKETEAQDSVNNVILSNSMQEFSDELRVYDVEREASHKLTITLAVIILLLSLLIVAFIYISFIRRHHMNQLKRAYERALESDKMKDAFIRNMSHEVRTPLNIIAGFAQVLANPELCPDDEERQKMAKAIGKNNDLITSHIDEMLELALNESSSEISKEDTVSISGLLRDLIREKKRQVPRGLTISVDTELPDDYTIVTHHNMLRRAIIPLIDNAIKNTTEGSITLGAKATDDQLILSVEDTGCGIPTVEAEHIFERFVKLDKFKEGIGLGLTLSRTIISRLGGSIRLDTTYHNGARFIITFDNHQ